MFTKIRKKIASIVTGLMVLQLAVFGIVVSPTGAFAYAGSTIKSLNVAGKTAKFEDNNVLLVDISDVSTMIENIDINLSDAAELTATFAGYNIFKKELKAGTNEIKVSDYYEEQVFIKDLDEVKRIFPGIPLKLVLSSEEGITKYSVYVQIEDNKKPEVSNLTFGAVVGKAVENGFNVDLTKSTDTDIQNATIEVSEDSHLAVSYADGCFEKDLNKGINKITADEIFKESKISLKDLAAIAVDGRVVLNGELKDNDFNQTNFKINLLIDTKAPGVQVTPEKIYVTDVKKAVSFDVVSIDGRLFKIDENSIEVNDTKTDLKVVVSNPGIFEARKTVTLSPEILVDGTNITSVDFDVVSPTGLLSHVVTKINVDTEVPAALENFTAVADTNGNVVLNWKAPTTNDYAKIVVYRDGTVIATLLSTANSYIDTNVVKGVAHSYSIYVYDAAGNFTTVSPITVTVPAPVVPSNQIASAAVNNTAKVTQAPAQTEEKEVKSESSENKEDDKKAGFPLWGIILLVILAGVGGYLFLTQQPASSPVTIRTEPVKPKAKPKKK